MVANERLEMEACLVRAVRGTLPDRAGATCQATAGQASLAERATQIRGARIDREARRRVRADRAPA